MELLSLSCSSSRDSRSYSAVIISKTSFAKISAQHLEQGSNALTCLYGEKEFDSQEMVTLQQIRKFSGPSCKAATGKDFLGPARPMIETRKRKFIIL